jgi:hypothetical protein
MALDSVTRNLTLNTTLRVNFIRCLEVQALHGGIVNVVRNLVKLVLRPRRSLVARPEKFELPAPRFEVKVDCVAQGISSPVTKEAALCAAAWCEYLDANARRYYGLLKDDELRAAQALAIKLERGALADGFTLRDCAAINGAA